MSEDIYRLTVRAPLIGAAARPGQFVMVRVSEGQDPLLRRPFSIHRVSDSGEIQLLFKVVGKGTGLLAARSVGQRLDMVGPLGHGYEELAPKERACLVGGGMGIAPLLFLARTLLKAVDSSRVAVFLGAQNEKELRPLVADFAALGIRVDIATDDGTMGHHGLVTDLLADLDRNEAGRLYVCGPYPMMKAVARKGLDLGWPCQVSLETMMACGLAACLGCAVPRKDGAGYIHVCKEGPVFEGEEVLWL